MSKIRVALTGVGNCALALIQGVHYYSEAKKEAQSLGLKHLVLGKYHPSDIEFVCAFDLETRKVGKDLSEAIFSKPNNTLKFADVPTLGVQVQRGPTLDGIGPLLKKSLRKARSQMSMWQKN